MNFDLKRPCANCPFRKVGAIELHPERVRQIVAGLLADDHQWFWCHKDAYARRPQHTACTGSMIYLLKVGQPNVPMRLAAAMGLLRYDDLRAQADDVIEPLAITCPRCGLTSWNLHDVREGYCGRCHEWTADVS